MRKKSIERKAKIIIPELIKWANSGADVVVDRFISCKLLNSFNLIMPVINGAFEFEILGENGESIALNFEDMKKLELKENVCCINLKDNKRAWIYIYKMPIGA